VRLLLSLILILSLNGCGGCSRNPRVIPALDESAFFETPIPTSVPLASSQKTKLRIIL
jgi:hypothetical protein